MAQKDRLYREMILEECAKHAGVTVEFGRGGKHPFALLRLGNHKIRHVYSGTSGDAKRGLVQNFKDLKRNLRALHDPNGGTHVP